MTLTTDPLGGKRGVTAGALGIARKPPPAFRSYHAGSSTFICQAAGLYRFVAWGPGGPGATGVGGGGGALVIAERQLTFGASVALSIGRSDASFQPADTTITFPTGEVLTAGAGKTGSATGAGGIATAGALDTKANGTAGTGAGDGGAAGGTTDHPGGIGATGLNDGEAPGGGGAITAQYLHGGDGLVLVCQIG